LAMSASPARGSHASIRCTDAPCMSGSRKPVISPVVCVTGDGLNWMSREE